MLALAACGNKGPLVMPDKPPPEDAAPAAPAAEPDQNDPARLQEVPAPEAVPQTLPPNESATPPAKPAQTLPLEDDE